MFYDIKHDVLHGVLDVKKNELRISCTVSKTSQFKHGTGEMIFLNSSVFAEKTQVLKFEAFCNRNEVKNGL